jgi:hypothetical protein
VPQTFRPKNYKKNFVQRTKKTLQTSYSVTMPIDKSWAGYAKGKVPDLGFEFIWQDATPADEPNRYPPQVYFSLGYEKKVLPRGWQRTPENKPLDLDIIFEKDVEIVLRDGVKV